MEITRHDLAKTTKELVGANGGQIELDGTVFLNHIWVGNSPGAATLHRVYTMVR